MTRTAARKEATRLGQKFPTYTFSYAYVPLRYGHVIHAVLATDPRTGQTALVIGLPGFVKANQGQFAWGNEQPIRHAAKNDLTAIARILRGEE